MQKYSGLIPAFEGNRTLKIFSQYHEMTANLRLIITFVQDKTNLAFFREVIRSIIHSCSGTGNEFFIKWQVILWEVQVIPRRVKGS